MSYIGKQPRKAALTSSDIEDGIITAAKIEDGAVVAAEIASNAVTTAKINADAVTAAKIADNAVVTAGINADAVDGTKIADNAINSEHYTDGSIDTAHIAADQITNAKIADDQIDSEHYVDGSIDTAHIADDAITSAKLGTGDMTFPNGNLVFGTSAKGVYLGVTSATAANLLNDYEEGTFTPSFSNGNGFDSISYAAQRGVYTKIGRIVNVRIQIELGANVSKNGNRIIVDGLPFTSSNAVPGGGLNWSYVNAKVINSTSTNIPNLWVASNSSAVNWYKTNGSNFTGNDISGSTTNLDVYINGTYQTDA